MQVINIEISRAVLEQKRQILAAEGTVLTGDHGTISHSGVELAFNYVEPILEIDVVSKPFFYPDSLVESQIRAWFAD